MTRSPSAGQITNRYGPRRNPVTGHRETHHGLDINSAAGRVLVAPERCRLVAYGTLSGWSVHGRVAQLQGASGVLHWLSHTERLAFDVRVGDWLDEGDPVAIMGMTGQTTGLHVHWETRYGKARRDPEAWLAATAGRPEPDPIPTPTPEPAPEPEEEEDDTMYKPTVHVRTEGAFEATLAHPQIGRDLEQHTGPATGGMRKALDGKVTIYRGFMVTADTDVYTAWARTHAKGAGDVTSRTNRDDYIDIQVEASRLAVELTS